MLASYRVSRRRDGSLRRMPRRPVPLRAISALFLQRQHLSAPRTTGLTAPRLGRFVEDVGGIQMDSINVLDRAHYLTVWSRFGPYDRARLDRLIYDRRLLFEYWAHAACLVSTGMLPWWRRAMLDYRVRHTGWSDLVRGNAKVLGHVKSTGAAPERDLAGYLTFPRFQRGARTAALRAMVERGEVAPIEVEGSSARWLTLTRDLPALSRAARASEASRGTTLLSPFDSLLWYRDRVKRLFGFDYRIEVYTPGHKRVHGYYTLPIPHDRHLLGRVDAKSHRAERRLEVRHVHLEPWLASTGTAPHGNKRVDQDETIAGLAEALRSL